MSPELEQSPGPHLFWDFLRGGYGLGTAPAGETGTQEVLAPGPWPLAQFPPPLDCSVEDPGNMGLRRRSSDRAGAQGMPAGRQATLGCQLAGQPGPLRPEGLLRDGTHGNIILTGTLS